MPDLWDSNSEQFKWYDWQYGSGKSTGTESKKCYRTKVNGFLLDHIV